MSFVIVPPFTEPSDHSNELLNMNLVLLDSELERIALAGSSISPSAFAALMLTWFNGLPTTLPAAAGVLWNNGGSVAQS